MPLGIFATVAKPDNLLGKYFQLFPANVNLLVKGDQKFTMVVDENHHVYLLSLAAIRINSLMSLETKLCTPSEGSTTCLK
jgi:hypothetical protein